MRSSPFCPTPKILYASQWARHCPESATSRFRICKPKIPRVHLTPHPKRHLDRFSRFCTADGIASLFTMGRTASSKLPLPLGEIWAHLIHGFLGPAQPSPQPKRHLDRQAIFCRAHYRDRPTNQPTDRPRYSVRNNRSHLLIRTVVLRCGLITVSTVVLNCCKGDRPSQWETPIFGPL